MCIAASVGRGGNNDRADVRTVQLLLQLNAPQAGQAMVADGFCGAATIAAISLYQHGVIGCSDSSGLVTAEPALGQHGGTTLRALRSGMPSGFSAPKLQAIYINTPAATIVRFFAALVASMAAAQIDTPLRRAHFLAQIGHESGELRYTEEIASGSAYEGRKDLGNTQPGDGVRFKGRGLIQITGRNNYKCFGDFCGCDLTGDAAVQTIARDPALAVRAAEWYWREHNLNALADNDDIVKLTRAINGGTNGLADRKRLLARARWILEPVQPAPAKLASLQAAYDDAEMWDLSLADAIL